MLVALAGSTLIELARSEGLQCIAEAFADRAYTPQGTLVSRREPGAVLHDPELVAQRMLRLVQSGSIEAIDGRLVRIEADSICVHGDSPAAVEMARELRRVLEQASTSLQPFAGKCS
ncbi:ATP-dependent DNA helicase DinG [Pseudomonas syringae pv. spinaceae]|uniref:ATP-dependent DNA helicase DinG n=1 Tax=Pseudomonas syringae pv. spinaceae TaxID=264459 RepID=A0A0Q0D8C4_PSESX|nr:ATP-dependent DNA helicase DinG [Pseudomonas syringae pv. spinaceae]